jgi:hypothetical protein
MPKKTDSSIQDEEMEYYANVSTAELQRSVWELEDERKEVNRKLNAIYAVLAARKEKEVERRRLLETTGQIPAAEKKK